MARSPRFALLVLVFAVVFACATFASPRAAAAGELQLATGPGAYASSWRGDGAFAQSLKLGYRMADLIAIDTVSRLGYAAVDERVLTYLSLGVTAYARLGRARPWARLALVHQHEEPLPAVRDDPGGTLFGVGDGVRHRGGGGASLGVDLPVHRKDRTEVFLGLDSSLAYFPDPRGPTLYFGGSLWAGVHYSL
jgi:hypothetical protein